MYLAHITWVKTCVSNQNGSAMDTLNGSLRLWVPGTFVI